MKLYRVRYSREGGNSHGFSWHTNRHEAVAAARKDYDEDPAEYDHRRESLEERIESVVIVPTRVGILSALRQYASHADNG